MRAIAFVALLAACGARVITKPVTLNSREKLLAGGSARFGAQLIMYPADALRTLAQTRTGAKTLADLGYKTLISGCATTSSFAFFVGGLQFSIFGALRPKVPAIVASACASLGSSFAGIPQEVIKQRLVTGIYPNFLTAVSKIARTEGLLGFYSGWAPTVSRNLPFVVICFCSFDAFKERALRDRPEGASLTTFENYAFGVSSALIGGLCTQPIDVVKTNIQVADGGSDDPSEDTFLRTAQHLYDDGGVAAFFDGLGPKLARAVVNHAVTFYVFDLICAMPMFAQ